MKLKNLSVLVLAFIIMVSLTTSAYAAPGIDGTDDSDSQFVQKLDNRPDPLTTKQLELKKQALEAKLAGKAAGKIHEVAKGQYVELEREGEGAIWTVLGEFPDLEHNTIPEPDRSVNNTTLWKPDFSREYYIDLLFNDESGANSMRNYYNEQSSGRYAVYGDVTDWIPVSKIAALYNDDLGGPAVWSFLQETINGWYDSQIDDGKTPEEIDGYLGQFDQWDRYDYDGDGNFDEPDGYIDTFQSVHAGEGEEGGAPFEAIWSHSWYAYSSDMGDTGPDFNKLGGVRIGESDYWVGKYTIQPENGGIGVFTHEFGHDLGLPDLYDTSGGENGTGFWTLMSSGSWMGDGTEDIGSKSSHMGAWEKFQLGWLNYEIARAGEKSTHRLGPMEFNTKQAQAVFVILPQKLVETEISDPYEGENFYYSGAGDDLDNFMYKSFDLPDGASLSAKVKYDIEPDWDYAYLVYSTDNGTTWTPLETNLSVTTDPNGQNFGYGITDSSSDAWVDLTASLPAGNVLLGFRYWTDGNTGGFGFMVDNIEIADFEPDGAEADTGWTFEGFHSSNGTEGGLYNNYYVLEYRTYNGYDSTLRDGPYFFGYADKPDFVDHFAYQDGLLINYWDTSQANNATRLHPGKGLLLPIDAHYETLYRADDVIWRNRIQTYDSTFSVFPTDGISDMHVNSVLSEVESLPAVSVFDDSNLYYDVTNPQGSVMNPNTGTAIVVRSQNKANKPPFMEILVRPAK